MINRIKTVVMIVALSLVLLSIPLMVFAIKLEQNGFTKIAAYTIVLLVLLFFISILSLLLMLLIMLLPNKITVVKGSLINADKKKEGRSFDPPDRHHQG